MNGNNTVRDKIVEILGTFPFKVGTREQLADELVARGVTVNPSLMQTVEMRIYNKEEIFENCTVQVLTNTFTGKTSIGWWHGSASDMPGNGGVQYEE